MDPPTINLTRAVPDAIDTGVEDHVDVRSFRALYQHVAVDITLVLVNLGMGIARNHVHRLRPEVVDQGERVDRPLNTLARSEQSPREQPRALFGVLRRTALDTAAPVRDDRDLSRVDVEI